MRLPTQKIYSIPLINQISLRRFLSQNEELFYYINNDYITRTIHKNYFFTQGLQFQIKRIKTISTQNISLDNTDDILIKIDDDSPIFNDLDIMIENMTHSLLSYKKEEHKVNDIVITKLFSKEINDYIREFNNTKLYNEVLLDTYEPICMFDINIETHYINH